MTTGITPDPQENSAEQVAREKLEDALIDKGSWDRNWRILVAVYIGAPLMVFIGALVEPVVEGLGIAMIMFGSIPTALALALGVALMSRIYVTGWREENPKAHPAKAVARAQRAYDREKAARVRRTIDETEGARSGS